MGVCLTAWGDLHLFSHPACPVCAETVVFDEGHTLKEAKTKQSKACCALAADNRWICTGTPVNNAIDDLYGQVGGCTQDSARLLCGHARFKGGLCPLFSGRYSGIPALVCLCACAWCMQQAT